METIVDKLKPAELCLVNYNFPVAYLIDEHYKTNLYPELINVLIQYPFLSKIFRRTELKDTAIRQKIIYI